MCAGPDVTRQWGWISSALPAFINGYDKPALKAPEQRQQSALTMAEEDDANIRILQSLRGKICKSDWRTGLFRLSRSGEGSVAQTRSDARGARRAINSVEAASSSGRSAGCRWLTSS